MIVKIILTPTLNPTTHTLIIVGDIDLKTAKSHAEKYFAKWAAGK
jgi:predicted Zn-dependent peptidase